MAVACRLTPDLEENLLEEIFRVGSGSDESDSEGENEGGVALVEMLKGLTISTRNVLDEKDRLIPQCGTHHAHPRITDH